LGTTEFIESLEETLQRRLRPQTGSRSERPAVDTKQEKLIFK
jgi:hypothetical protein